MSYWSAKSDLEFMEKFKADVCALWAKEDEYANWQHPNPRYLGPQPDVEDDPAYQEVRERIAKGMTRAEGIARRLRVGHSLSNLLWTGYHQPDRQSVRDALNGTVGAVEDEVRIERRHIWNPLWWLLHGPFLLLRSAGINTDKVEQRLWSRVLVQFAVDLAVGVLAALVLVALGVGR